MKATRSSSSATETGENRFLGSITRNLLSRSSFSSKLKNNNNNNINKNKFFSSENTPPLHPNIQLADPPLSPSVPKPPPPPPPLSPTTTKSLSSLPGPVAQPQSPSAADPTLKKETARSEGESEEMATSDPAVKVVVRIRPVNGHERKGDVKKVSEDLLSIGDRRFTFDSVLDSSSNQEDVFQLVGVPLVQSALAGYNASVLSCGQTGSGKTYTLWGPPSAMVEDPSPSGQQGIVPRIFQMLFSEIQKENPEGKQINYQCRCSFLEIYNEQIGDLLDPVQRNLEIRDDPKNGLYVENLTEEYVSSYEDVTQILIKGLSNRKVGATSINSKSSRSHVVFTFIIESWCKGSSSKCFSSSKISRITLVDLAGLDRNRDDDASRQYAKEDKNVKKSLSQLGLLVSTLSQSAEMGKLEDVPYKGSCLTHLLRESLGGNAKLTVICSISADNKNNGETLRTLRFGQRVKSIKNEPVVNEISEDDVNDLSDQIRQLKEELIRAKSDACISKGRKSGYFKGQSIRGSLNHLRVSLNRSLMIPELDNDSENEVDVDEDDLRELHQHFDKLESSCEDNSRDLSENRDSIHYCSVEESFEAELMSEDEVIGPEETQNEEITLEKYRDPSESKDTLKASGTVDSTTLSIMASRQSTILQEPILSESPKIGNTRKSMVISSTSSESKDNVLEISNLKPDVQKSLKGIEHIQSSLRSSKMFPGPTESLAASLQRGLQIIDHHQRNSASHRSSVSFSFEHLALKPSPEADRAGSSIEQLNGPSASLLCVSCRQKITEPSNEVKDSLKRSIVAVDEAGNRDKLTTSVAKDKGNRLAAASEREKELENVCKDQAAKIQDLNLLLEQYKHEREQSIPAQDQYKGLEDQNESLKSVDVEKEKCDIKEVQEVLNLGNSQFDAEEKEALLKEIQMLRTKLQSHTDTSTTRSTDQLRSSLLAQSIQLRKSVSGGLEDIEQERQRWTEMESEWISLTDDLRIDLESSRRRAEKVEMELNLEKKCSEELDDALKRAVLGHARMVEHYTELQEKYNDLVGKHRAMMEGIAEVKRAAAKAGKKGGNRFAKALSAELSATRVERERERELLKKENKNLKLQLRDTAEAVHAAGELLVRLREVEHTASVAEENFAKVQEDNDKLKKQIEKLKRKHKMEMITMKQYLAESRLPESALQPLYRDDSDVAAAAAHSITPDDDDQAWRAEFGAIYQDHY